MPFDELRAPIDLSDWHSGSLADVLDALGVSGTLSSQIRPLNPAGLNKKVLARAYTVRWAPVRKGGNIKTQRQSTWDDVKNFLVPELSDGRGRVYVGGVDDGILSEYALAGGLSATHFEKIGFAACLVGGGIRDAHVLRELGLPVWASNFIPTDTQGNYRVVETGTYCRIGTLTVQTGDWVFLDETGAVVIPAALFEEVQRRTADIEKAERHIEREVAAGRSLYEAVDLIGRI